MFIVTVTFNLKPGGAAAFMPMMHRQAIVSLEREPDCHQFDVCVDPEDEHRVFLYEQYSDKAAFDLHLAASHFQKFDEEVAPLVLEKRVNVWKLEELVT